MARIGGRNAWIAVPAGMLCAAVVGALVWLSLPMVPVSVAWLGDTLRNATAPLPAPTAVPTPAQDAATGAAVDCRSMYSDDLWNELTWHPGSLLSQSLAAPATEAHAFADAVTADVAVTCVWRFDGGGIVTTLARIDADASALAEPSLTSDGFACSSSDAALECTRTRGSVVELHTLRNGLWLVSVETGWHPEDFGARLEHHVFG
ncbi:hypothetical protein [Microbacterium kyungheense]|uniref:Uncharacterized protein n=1 Tax=Microbacterium kyungheense TaxID=1263636 RepID=A0A543FJR1_9MICO|nr:hypothetical protein [Microbacterium kyungheense]TQM34012.1 hypothetical protein FB391_0299 [Microbacterium kyungheense]